MPGHKQPQKGVRRRVSEYRGNSRLHVEGDAELGLGTKGEEHDGHEGHAKVVARVRGVMPLVAEQRAHYEAHDSHLHRHTQS